MAYTFPRYPLVAGEIYEFLFRGRSGAFLRFGYGNGCYVVADRRQGLCHGWWIVLLIDKQRCIGYSKAN